MYYYVFICCFWNLLKKWSLEKRDEELYLLFLDLKFFEKMATGEITATLKRMIVGSTRVEHHGQCGSCPLDHWWSSYSHLLLSFRYELHKAAKREPQRLQIQSHSDFAGGRLDFGGLGSIVFCSAVLAFYFAHLTLFNWLSTTKVNSAQNTAKLTGVILTSY